MVPNEHFVMITVQTLMDGFDEAVRSSAENIESVHGKHWDARLDVARTVVSIAAAILAGTVTFLDKVSSDISNIQGISLIGSWTLLVVSIAAGLFVLLQTVTLRSFHPKAFNGRVFVHNKFSALDLGSPNAPTQAAQIIRKATDEIFNAMGRADNHAQFAARACLISFLASMLAFLSYALARLLP
jgi:hypothetical protein